MRLERHYAYKFCSPSRCSFLSGRLPFHVNQGQPQGVLSTGGMDLRMTTIGEKLQEAQIETHFYGKWHAGQRSPAHLPYARGFNVSILRPALQSWSNPDRTLRKPCLLPPHAFTQILILRWVCAPQHSLGFLTGAENHFTQIVTDPTYGSKVDLWLDEGPAPNDINGSYGTYIYAEAAIRALRNFSARLKGPDPPRGIFIYQAWQGKRQRSV